MQALDIAIIVFFLAGSILLGFWQGKSNKNTGDYFLGGHKLPWIVAMLSIVATETSVLTFVSVPGLAYRGDWTFLQLPLGYIFGRMLVSVLLLPVYFRNGVTSIYEVIGTRFGSGMQKLASVVFLVTRILGDGVRFLATGVVVQVVTGWSLPVSVMIIGIVTLAYTISGGLKTVVWLDSIQFGLYLLGGVITITFILIHLETSLPETLVALADSGKFTMLNTKGNILFNPMSFGSAFIGGIFLSFASHGIDYMMVQRALGCGDLNSARKALIGSGFFVFFQFMIFLLAGSLMYLFMHDIPQAKDREFATFIVNYLPSGLKGVLLAGILSAAMSTISSSINSLAASTVTDLLGGRASLGMSKIISAGWAAVLISIALMFDESDKAIIMMGLEIASFTYGGLLGLFLLSRTNRHFQPASLAAGLLASMGIVFLLKLYGIAWTWYILVSVIANLFTAFIMDMLITKRTKSG
ncbi:MAG: sodium:solute symporter [Chlorobium sp.]|jgi:SSS family solute:Na+ symporter|uniref:sodium:solute symporter n=1 Tax=Chlorobium sp. TaxID=1095 RepID=UPI0025BD76CA|nr:sodium:solute symporter [Chlorobium sp.]MCF8215513.1 sodium:solute symporter [Chlorobium sp.]MCF8270433.1 sodium:solute symporter [Chlorobium sp.]MCF8286803.1 sodium:solute symporter [Chlorobium sp.]MCF8290325.1 sodium:solute symporter [Chlorobium sp.]MCF8384484.1 sodium:solute symporter [Chlorobium sp.]